MGINPQLWKDREVAVTITMGALLTAASSAALLFVWPQSWPAREIGANYLFRALFGSCIAAAMSLTMAFLKRPGKAKRVPVVPKDDERWS